MPRTLTLGLASLLLASLAAAETVHRDEWGALFEGGAKIGWWHEVVTQGPGGYRVETWRWRRAGEGLREAHEVTDTDLNGRILLLDERETSPWGTQSLTLEPWEDELKWTRVTTGGRELSGRLAADAVWSPEVIVLRVLRGELPQGKRQIPTLDVPGEGVETKDYELTREADGGWRVVGPNFSELRDREGRFVEGSLDEAPVATLRAATADDAADTSVQVAPPELEAPVVEAGALESGGVRVTRLDPTWQLMYIEIAEHMDVLGCETASGAGLMVMNLPIPLPEDAQARMDLAEGLRQKMNAQREELQFGAPEATRWRGRDAVRFEITGEDGGDPMEGEAHLVGGAAGMHLAILAWPKERRDALAAERQRLDDALQLTTATRKRATLTRVRVDAAGITLKVPEGWKGAPALAPTQWVSPAGASRISVSSGTLPPGVELRAAQDAWLEAQEANPAFDVALESSDELQVAGRTAYRLIFKGDFIHDGIRTPIRAASFAFPQPNQGFVEVVVLSFELDSNLDDLDAILESVSFVEAH